MRSMLIATVCVTAVCAAAPAASARDSRTAGLVRRTLEAGARGECPARLMQPALRRKCLEQMPGVQSDLSRLGPIAEIQRLGRRKDRRLGEVGVYRVRFARGRMVWVARTAPDGRLTVLESPD